MANRSHKPAQRGKTVFINHPGHILFHDLCFFHDPLPEFLCHISYGNDKLHHLIEAIEDGICRNLTEPGTPI